MSKSTLVFKMPEEKLREIISNALDEDVFSSDRGANKNKDSCNDRR